MSTAEPITSIFIPETRDLTLPSRHTVYIISVGGPVRAYPLTKRYRDFHSLDEQLSELDSRGTPIKLPQKSFNFMGIGETREFVEERRKGLERYLQAILYHKDPIWRRAKAWIEFFNLSEFDNQDKLVLQSTTSDTTIFSNFRWLQEYESLFSFCVQIRSVLNERDRFASQGDSSSAHSKKFQARKAIKQAQESLQKLDEHLGLGREAGGVAAGELERRRDLLRGVASDLEELEGLARTLSTLPGTVTVSASANISTSKAQLFEGSGGVGQSLSSAPASSSRRVFGKPAETERTRMLDNNGLLRLQELEMKAQDHVVESLGKVVERQKEIGLVISRELDQQNLMLEGIEEQANRVQNNLKTADKKAKRILKG